MSPAPWATCAATAPGLGRPITLLIELCGATTRQRAPDDVAPRPLKSAAGLAQTDPRPPSFSVNLLADLWSGFK